MLEVTGERRLYRIQIVLTVFTHVTVKVNHCSLGDVEGLQSLLSINYKRVPKSKVLSGR